MTKRENEILTRLAQIIPKLPENKQERILGVAEGMSAMKEELEARKAGQEVNEMPQIAENSLKVCANGLTGEEINEIRSCIRRIAKRRKSEGKKGLNWKLELNSRKYVPRKKRDTKETFYLAETIPLRK